MNDSDNFPVHCNKGVRDKNQKPYTFLETSEKTQERNASKILVTYGDFIISEVVIGSHQCYVESFYKNSPLL